MNPNEMEEENDSFEDSLLRYNPLTLKELAGYQVALKTWYSYIPHYDLEDEDFIDLLEIQYEADGFGSTINDNQEVFDKALEWAEPLDIPKNTQQLVAKCIFKVINETWKWMFYLKKELALIRLTEHCINQFDPYSCIWRDNGTIDYKNSAIKLLSKPELDQVQKFELMCHFCFEDEIEALRIPPRDIFRLIDSNNLTDFHRYAQTFYWICNLSNELHKIPLDNFNIRPVIFMPTTLRIEFVMASMNCNTGNDYAFEYFWDRLDANEKILAAGLMIHNTHYNYSRDPQRLFAKMSGHQQNQLLSLIPSQIIHLCWFRLGLAKLASDLWGKYKNSMPESYFSSLVCDAFYRFGVRNEEAMSLLVKMWDAAPEQSLRHLLTNKEYFIINTFRSQTEVSSSGLKLIYRFLSLKAEDFRKLFIFRWRINLALCSEDVEFTDNLVRLCISDHSVQFLLKQSILDSTQVINHCRSLLIQEKFDVLKQKLQMFSPNLSATVKYLKQIIDLHKTVKRQFMDDFHKWTNLSVFFDQIFPNHPEVAEIMKKKIVSSFAIDSRNDFPSTDGLPERIKVAESIFQNEDLEKTKKLFLQPFRVVFKKKAEFWWYFIDHRFLDAISWCWSRDEKYLRDMKFQISADIIFEKMFNFLEEEYLLSGDFDQTYVTRFDTFLKWLYPEGQLAKKYKLDKLAAIDDLDIFRFFSEQKDESRLEILLLWFFDGDEEVIRKFKGKKLRSE